MKSFEKLVIIQPVLTSYRVPLFEALSVRLQGRLLVCAGPSDNDFGNPKMREGEFLSVNWRRFFLFRLMPLKNFMYCFKSATTVIHVADFKFSSLWLFLVFCFFSNKKFYLHGQGGYKKKGHLHRAVYVLTVFFSNGYICYTDYSADRLKNLLPRSLHKKVSVVENMLYLDPVVSISNRCVNDLFYIGRLRDGCGIELLLEAAMLANVNVRVIGSGDESFIEKLKANYSCAKFYGAVFERDAQLEIGRDCLAGAYGGDAGLSVVHYMAFGLPVIVHNQIDKHMGPEPTYIENNVNGLTFERGNATSLSECIIRLKEDTEFRNKLAVGALTKFNFLTSPTMDQKIANILGLV